MGEYIRKTARYNGKKYEATGKTELEAMTKLAEKLAAQGVEVTTQPRLLATQNGYVCNIKDPDGIALEFIDRVSLFEV